MHTRGICIGASSLKYLVLDWTRDPPRVVEEYCEPHEGDAAGALERLVATLPRSANSPCVVTGRGLNTHCGLTSISEIAAVEEGLAFSFEPSLMPRTVISFGGETLLLYRVTGTGKIESVHSGNKCASGKGAFFLQQIARMNLDVEQALAAAHGATPCALASRCSVFCKSDCTHALNKGEPIGNVVAGLCAMMADSALELLGTQSPGERVALIGGVARNHGVCELLRTRFPLLVVPPHAVLFEALGAAGHARHAPCRALSAFAPACLHATRARGTLAALAPGLASVRFAPASPRRPDPEGTYVLGLDAGSTTTKGVLVGIATRAVAASVYLRTNGNPVEAARACYRVLRQEMGEHEVHIRGLGTTGSGRHLTGLHADTPVVIDEILAHATAAVHYDPGVDTIFEIGGQDAKYTHLTAGVPSEYAMNEACSAGTGSFLEEAAAETMHCRVEEIAGRALRAAAPSNFSDQCAAFIGSDVKRAIQQGAPRNDVLAGLVYSICLNYLTKVKGNRRSGRHIFMQGGVCYNPAVPAAMAALTGSRITVPPDPGLMGALGVALEVLVRLENGTVAPAPYSLTELIERRAVREGSFTCGGGKEHCDRRCTIARIRVGGQVRSFGGMCNRFYNQRIDPSIDAGRCDLVEVRRRLLVDSSPLFPPAGSVSPKGTVGISRSFAVHQLLPLYTRFFTELGFEITLSEPAGAGRGRVLSSFCFPAEIAHGAFLDLVGRRPDFLFLPVVKHFPVPGSPVPGETCVLVQGEPSYLRATFREEIAAAGSRLLTPVLWMQKGYREAFTGFAGLAPHLECSPREVREAFEVACTAQEAFESALLERGRAALQELHREPHRSAIVLFGRPYNAFAPEADRGVAHKIASRGVTVIPCDMLDTAGISVQESMFWGSGQKILKGAGLVARDPQLFGFYMTNFSCGPDSFLLGYFRTIMQEKPWLTLELDGHSADAGIDTRIDAALSIIERYRTLGPSAAKAPEPFRVARVIRRGKWTSVVDSGGREHGLRSPGVELLLPSMGRRGTDALAAFFRGAGINARALPTPDRGVLDTGRGQASCKECLPYHLTTGSFLSWLREHPADGKVSLLFLPSAAGPCRLGQYAPALEQIIEQQRIPDTAVFTLTDEDSYSGLGTGALLNGWKSVVLGDVFGDIAAMLRLCAADTEQANRVFDRVWEECLAVLEGRSKQRLGTFLDRAARTLAALPLKRSPASLPVVSLVGEIFVRREEFSRRNLVDYLEEHGFFVKVAPVHEYFYYADYCIACNLGEKKAGVGTRLHRRLSVAVQERIEADIKRRLARSGLYRFEMVAIGSTITHAAHLLSREFRGEHHLSVGLGLREMLTTSCGVVSVGPFGCMPSRVAEALMATECGKEGLERIPGRPHGEKRLGLLHQGEMLPFLAIESDGGEYPQLVEARLEAFVLQARRMHERMLASPSS